MRTAVAADTRDPTDELRVFRLHSAILSDSDKTVDGPAVGVPGTSWNERASPGQTAAAAAGVTAARR